MGTPIHLIRIATITALLAITGCFAPPPTLVSGEPVGGDPRIRSLAMFLQQRASEQAKGNDKAEYFAAITSQNAAHFIVGCQPHVDARPRVDLHHLPRVAIARRQHRVCRRVGV